MRIVQCLFMFVFCVHCHNVNARDIYPKVFETGQSEIKIRADNQSALNVRVTIVTPPKVRGNILVLPGWKFNSGKPNCSQRCISSKKASWDFCSASASG